MTPFVAEIGTFAFNFPPKGWAFCNGQLMPISQNTALFALLGTFYGGDGKSTFALPNLQDSVAIHRGQGQGLSEYFQGQQGGTQFVTLIQSEMPFHSHSLNANALVSGTGVPSPDVVLSRAGGGSTYNTTNTPIAPMAPQAVSVQGGSLPHNNMMPYLTINFSIALQGVFPARN